MYIGTKYIYNAYHHYIDKVVIYDDNIFLQRSDFMDFFHHNILNDVLHIKLHSICV